MGNIRHPPSLLRIQRIVGFAVRHCQSIKLFGHTAGDPLSVSNSGCEFVDCVSKLSSESDPTIQCSDSLPPSYYPIFTIINPLRYKMNSRSSISHGKQYSHVLATAVSVKRDVSVGPIRLITGIE